MSKILDFVNEHGGIKDNDFKFWMLYTYGDGSKHWVKGRIMVEMSKSIYNIFDGQDYKVMVALDHRNENYFGHPLDMYTDGFMGYVDAGMLIPCEYYTDYEVVEKKGAEYLTPFQIIEHSWEELEKVNVL